jgi:uracil phosphoribosyltransferase
MINSNASQRFLTFLRSERTDASTFRWASDNLARILCAEAIGKLPHRDVAIQTPVGPTMGRQLDTKLMVLPIYRAGQSLVQAFLGVAPDAAVGSVLIQRNEKTAEPKLYYKKLPKPLPEHVIILDPMLATAGSAVMAVDILKQEGYDAESIFFTGVVASQPGYDRLTEHIPAENMTIAAIDPELNEQKYIVPGLGDYGDRYFGT